MEHNVLEDEGDAMGRERKQKSDVPRFESRPKLNSF